MLLNLDAGESGDEPETLWASVDIINVACGGHAGDAASMTRLVTFCAAHERLRLGAHPSYPDREGFGRRSISIDPTALARAITAQLRELSPIAAASGMPIAYLKPHGALYHDAASSPPLAALVLDAAITVLGPRLTIIGPPTGALRDVAATRGLLYLREGFADRRTRPGGSLVSRSEPDAVITDPAACGLRARELVREVDTICIHADTPNAVAIVSAVRTASTT